jgi:septum formation inhibitor MinC
MQLTYVFLHFSGIFWVYFLLCVFKNMSSLRKRFKDEVAAAMEHINKQNIVIEYCADV